MLVVALISNALLLVWMGFFMMGSLPLLILKHDTPVDARFIRGLFNVYYTAILATGTVGALSYAFAGRAIIAIVLGAVAAIGFAGRRWVIAHMDAVRSAITADDLPAIRRFRRLHIAGMLLNVAMLAVVFVGMLRISPA